MPALRTFMLITSIFMLACLTNNLFSQEEKIYAFNKDGSPQQDFKKCDNFISVIKKSDTEYIARFYNKTSPMLRQETYFDANLEMPNGEFIWYNINGEIDSSGIVKHSKKDGKWYVYGDSMKWTYYNEYDNGKYVARMPANNEKYDSTKAKKDTTEKEAQFINDDYGNNWGKYLTRNIPVPTRMETFRKAGNYPVVVLFVINKKGEVEDVTLMKSQEWQIDIATIRLIEKSPTWRPAVQDGKNVYYRQKQKITYQVQDE